MKRTVLTRLVSPVLKAHGYEYASGAFVKSSGDMLAMIYLNKSQWSDSISVQFGVGPTSLCLRSPPKWPSHLSLGFDTRDIQRFREHVDLQILSAGGDPSPVALEAVFDDMAKWIDANVLPAEKLLALARDPSSWVNLRSRATLDLKRWAGLPLDP